MEHDAEIDALLADAVARWQPAAVRVFVGTDNSCSLQRPVEPFSAIAGLTERVDLAVLLVSASEGLPVTELAALRDQWGAITLLVLAGGNHGAEAFEQQLRSLGLTRYPHTAGNIAAFYFDIASYKATPDWFNAKGWANPENWNKYRW